MAVQLKQVLGMMRAVGPLGIAASLAWSGAAWAAWPDDISLTSMSDIAGGPVTDPALENTPAYETVVRELGVSIANKPLPADTLGVNGFELAVSTTIAFTDTREPEYGVPGPWGQVHAAEDPTPALIIPRLELRKGLPMSLETGGQFGWLAVSRQMVVGGYGRWSPLEGYDKIPNVNLQLGYTGYIGNEELELGVMDFAGTISYTLPFGRLLNVNSATFTPYAGAGRLTIHAEPRLSPEVQQELGVRPVSGFAGADLEDAGDPLWKPAQVYGGFRIVSQHFQFRAAGVWAPSVLPTVHVAMGFVY